MTMKTAFAAAMIGSLGLTPVFAADVYQRDSLKDAPVPYAEPYETWGGFYVGGHVGGVWSDSYDFAYLNDEATRFDENEDDGDIIGGVHAGYNWQFAQKVFGIEGDVSFADGIDYLASIRGRLGYALGERALLYGTGGVAFLGLNDSYDFEDDDTKVGFVVGGGLDFKVASNVSIGVEGLYYNFEDSEFESAFYTADSDVDFYTVRGRLTFHTGGGAAEPLK